MILRKSFFFINICKHLQIYLTNRCFERSTLFDFSCLVLSRLQEVTWIITSLENLKNLKTKTVHRWYYYFYDPFTGRKVQKACRGCKNQAEAFKIWLAQVGAERLDEIANIKSGFTFKGSAFKTEGEYQVLRLGNVNLRVEEKAVFVSGISESDLLKAKVNIGDLVITQTGTKGKRDYDFVAIIDRENLLLNQRLRASWHRRTVRYPQRKSSFP